MQSIHKIYRDCSDQNTSTTFALVLLLCFTLIYFRLQRFRCFFSFSCSLFVLFICTKTSLEWVLCFQDYSEIRTKTYCFRYRMNIRRISNSNDKIYFQFDDFGPSSPKWTFHKNLKQKNEAFLKSMHKNSISRVLITMRWNQMNKVTIEFDTVLRACHKNCTH